jgi:hypothetical protein
VLRNYCSRVNSNQYTYPKTQSAVTAGRVVAAGIYAGAAVVGFRAAGPMGAAAGMLLVPEVITVPLILA